MTVTPSATVAPEVTASPEITTSPTTTPTLEPTLEVTATAELTATPTVTAAHPIAAEESYPIVTFDSVPVNIENSAAIKTDQTPLLTDTATVPVIRIVDPALTKSANPKEAVPGDHVAYTVVAENLPTSNANATDIAVQDVLPHQLDLITFSVSGPAGSGV